MGILRTVLALLVVFPHIESQDQIANIGLMGGAVMAVNLFFIMSGFYMALVLDGKYDSVLSFYKARALRLFPLYWATVVVTLVVILLFVPESNLSGKVRNWSRLDDFWITGAMVFSNVTFFGLDAANFFCAKDGVIQVVRERGCTGFQGYTILPQAWTLGAEVLFYALIPWILRAGWSGIWLTLGIGLGSQATLYFTGMHNPPYDRMLFPVILVYFMGGVLAYRLYKYLDLGSRPQWAPALITVSVSIVLAYAYFRGRLLGINFLLYPAFALFLPFLFAATRNSRIDAAIGEWSFPLYITHVTAIIISNAIIPDIESILGRLSFHLAVVFGIALIGIVAVANPVERVRSPHRGAPDSATT